MNRVHISYSEAILPVTPLFGPVRLLHLGDMGHHKVNKTADMAHWVMRTIKISVMQRHAFRSLLARTCSA